MIFDEFPKQIRILTTANSVIYTLLIVVFICLGAYEGQSEFISSFIRAFGIFCFLPLLLMGALKRDRAKRLLTPPKDHNTPPKLPPMMPPLRTLLWILLEVIVTICLYLASFYFLTQGNFWPLAVFSLLIFYVINRYHRSRYELEFAYYALKQILDEVIATKENQTNKE
ncbi:hypothetical protein ABER99_21735 [Paenibacillus glucanolyticus]|jgi:amino acid transporter|uniref:Uncharacterized protein n=1 Tax=Paenibacillus glucanolyticus TaxID=59843 RepID=A0A163GR65_9BACL|nr:hypothetical protein [Paenibacillus glucanolyticus]KZS45105.1 hypothetical protein AWU65_03745 [Paenibacillus glucanolyticus]OMF65474.1 hypothetical protein BK142_30750 [Paenibacillus glucanolyticus]